jgi:hypothetical protein
MPGMMEPNLEFLELFIYRDQNSFHSGKSWVAGGHGGHGTTVSTMRSVAR